MTRLLADLAGITCTACLVLVASPNRAWSTGTGITGTFNAVQTVHDTIPCTGERWPRQDDTTKAAVLAGLAAQMQRLADSVEGLLVSEEGSGAPHEIFTSAAWAAYFAAAFGPDHLPTLLVAGQVTSRASDGREGVVDTVWAKRAECYARRAGTIAQQQGNQIALAQARKLLEAMRSQLSEARRAAELERERREVERRRRP